MSVKGYEELMILNRKLDELLIKYETIRTELTDLKTFNNELTTKLQEKEIKLNELEIKYERVKLSGALLGDGDNALEAKKKITDLVREIDRCVALLNR